MGAIAFDEFARPSGQDLDLEVGAFLLARDAFPELAIDAQIGRLDALATGLGDLAGASTEDAASAIAAHVYERHGFRGNESAYADPANSYLNVVLDRRTGIPITLAIVLLAVARRVGVRAQGISFPGHFLVRFERARGGPLVVDPFFGGRAMSVDDLGRLLRRTAGPTGKLQVEHLKSASTRQILVRVLQNLKAAHLARGDVPRALVAAARVVALLPRDGWAVRDRGLLQAQLGAPEGARADLLRYLELAPESSDAGPIRQMLGRLGARTRGAALN